MIYALCLVLVVTPIWNTKRKVKTGIILLCILLLVTPFVAKEFDRSIRITFIDVGQGDSILIQGPRNQTILIDGGGEGYSFPKEDWQKKRNPYEVGKNVVVPTLRSLGVTQLNWLVLTHGDADHIGGLQEVVRSIPINKVLVNGVTAKTDLEIGLQAMIAEKDIPIFTATAGPWLNWHGDIKWEILNPSNPYVVEKGNDNDASIVLLLSAYDRKFIFTGDLESEGEMRIRKQYGDFVIDVLKVGHHGSKTSTSNELLDGIAPKFAIISVGENNHYGHPHPDVVQRLNDYNVDIYRTDHDGAITLALKPSGKLTYKGWK